MEEEEADGEGEDLTPFWLQTTADLRRSVSAVIFSSGLVLFLLLAIAAAFLLFILPSNSVKKSWDSINIVLVLVAVVFGFLTRNKSEERYSDSELQAISGKQFESEKSTMSKWYAQKLDVASSSPRQWYEFQDRSEAVFLRRNSSSYPDLREFSSLNWAFGDYQRRFFDDSSVDSGRIRTQAQDMDLDLGPIHRRHRSMEVQSLSAPPQTKTVVVDTLLSKAKEAADMPPKPAEENRRGTSQTTAVPMKERSRRRPSRDLVPPPDAKSPPPPPPPPLPPRKSERKRGGATGSATKDFLNSLYHKKKKKQRQKSVDNLDSLHHAPQPPAIFQIPPPPPPPSPPSVLQNLFSSKKQKRKRTIKVTLVPNPNPQTTPSPANQIPSNPINLHTLDETSNSGGESPLHRGPPPPPPPPPFVKTTPAWRFVVQGDYVRVNSSTSSRSGSPDPDELDSDVTPSSVGGGDATPFHPSPLFCPSPDVDTKAESFISSFRANLKLEKAHSIKKREPGLSTLGPKQA